MFVDRAFKRRDGTLLSLGEVPSADELRAAGGQVVASDGVRAVCEDSLYIIGEIPRVTTYEKGLPA